MLDLAKRVYDHSFRIDPIVRSLLDTDFYKLLMAQTILRRHPQVETTFGIANRTAGCASPTRSMRGCCGSNWTMPAPCASRRAR